MNRQRMFGSMSWPERIGISGAIAFVLGLTLALAAGAGFWQVRKNANEAQNKFDALVNRVTAQITLRMQRYEYGLRGARGVILGHRDLSIKRADFLRYSNSREIDREFPGARGFGVIWRVPAEKEADFVAAARRDGWPDFAVRQFAPHDGERYIIQYVEPVARNREEVGLDIASETNRREAAQAAMRSGTPTLTAPITLPQAAGKPERSFLLLLPVYRPGMALDSVAQRVAATAGWVFAPLVIDEVLQDSDTLQQASQFILTLRDQNRSGAGNFYVSSEEDTHAATDPHRRIALPMFGRFWEADLYATPEFINALNQTSPLRVGLAAGLVWLLCSALLILLGQLALRSRHISIEQARRAAIVSASDDAIIVESLDGTVTDWNHGAERLFGYLAKEAVGRQSASLMLPPERAGEDAELRAKVAQGEYVHPFEATRMHRDGSLFDVSVSITPIHSVDGICIGFAITMRDIRDAKITQRKLAEFSSHLETQVVERTTSLNKALRDSEALLRTLHKYAIISVTDAQGLIVEVNDNFCAISGYRREELLGQGHSILNSGYHSLDFWNNMWDTITSGQPWRGEFCQRAKDGSLYWVNSIIAPLVGEDGKIQKYISILNDISAHKNSEEALRKTNERFNLAADSVGLGVWDYDIVTGALVWDERMYRLYDRSRSGGDEVYSLWSSSVHPDDLERSERELQAAIEGKQHFDTVFRICLSDGSVRHLKAAGRVIRDETGKALRMIGLNYDVSERVRAEAELRQTMLLLRAVLDSATQFSIFAARPEGLITVFNAGAEKMLGYSASEIVDRENTLHFHVARQLQERAKELSEQTGREISAAKVLTAPAMLGQPQEWLYRRKDGSLLPVLLVITAMFGEEGELLGYVNIAYDISQQKEHERNLQLAVNKANQANRAKSQFLANMSHEIRTPMNAVIGLIYLMERTGLNAEQAATLSKVKLASKSLLHIINDVLDLSKIEAGEMNLERVPFSLRQLLKELSDLLAQQARDKSITFTLDTPADLPVLVEGDSARLRQVLTNLISNAIKFTDQGGVRLEVAFTEVEEGVAHLRFVVHDSGIGIAPAAMSRLFAPFVQADTSTTRRFGGTGLGLSIVKQLVNLMGGEVGVTSTVSVGSKFRVELSLPICAGDAIAAPVESIPIASGPGLRGVHILVVDDSPINLDVARRILELEGAMVWVASNGQQAVDFMRKRPDMIDAILMDVQMPVMDGLDATRYLRNLSGMKNLPIIALTAGMSANERHKIKEADMTDVVGKPFDPPALVSCIQRYVEVDNSIPDLVMPRRAEVPPDWPHIPGIDAEDASRRLRGDTTLFRSMLRRLFKDFESLSYDETHPDNLIKFLHSLKGSAGTLGAWMVQQDADEAETAWRDGRLEDARDITRRLSEEMLQLKQNAEIAFGAAPMQVEAKAQTIPLNENEVAQLLVQLRNFDFGAVESFNALSSRIREHLIEGSYTKLAEHMENLQFTEAAELIETNVLKAAAFR
ncbi:MAG: PAS domain S-box protein [Burkholderiaceae bacterium]|nr:MAG: PAS domain S-box protein [Burkholderiaceae bacterium]